MVTLHSILSTRLLYFEIQYTVKTQIFIDMIVLEFKLSDLNVRLAEHSAIYAFPVTQCDDKSSYEAVFPDFLKMPADILKSLFIIGLGKVLSKLKGWIKGYQTDDARVLLTLDISADDKYFAESLISQSVEAYIMAETCLTTDEALSEHFRGYFADAVESLVCYLSYLQQKRCLTGNLIQRII